MPRYSICFHYEGEDGQGPEELLAECAPYLAALSALTPGRWALSSVLRMDGSPPLNIIEHIDHSRDQKEKKRPTRRGKAPVRP